MLWRFIGDLDVFETWRNVQNAYGVKLSFTQYTGIYRDEARHGKAFEGLLKRYFN